jgi:hypothetical protein
MLLVTLYICRQNVVLQTGIHIVLEGREYIYHISPSIFPHNLPSPPPLSQWGRHPTEKSNLSAVTHKTQIMICWLSLAIEHLSTMLGVKHRESGKKKH